MPYLIGKMFPATVATVKCPSDLNINGHSYNCLTFKWTNLTVTQCTKTEELFSVRKAIFAKPLPLVLRFSLPPRQDITSLAYPDGFRQAQVVWLRETRQDGLSVPSLCCLENIIFHERLLWMQRAFAFRLFFPKRKAFADIHRNVGLVRSIMI